MTTSKRLPVEKPLPDHTRKQIRFAEILAKGIYTAAEAARQAGFSENVARAKAYAWVGETRSDSLYPVLWDYYEKLRKKNLRLFDDNADAIRKELALLAYTDVTKFMDLPRREYDQKMLFAREIVTAVNAVELYSLELEQYNLDAEKQDQGKGKKKKLRKPIRPTERQYEIVEKFAGLSENEQRDILIWKDYQSGSIRLKNAEDIPECLLPVIAEISQTRDGIKLKLHDKLGALDKLARINKMYETKPEDDGGKGHIVTDIKIEVRGSRSTLHLQNPEG
jgi:hypothetical protein